MKRNNDWEVRAATTEEFMKYGNYVGYTVRAWVLEVAGKIVGIGGVVMLKRAWTVFVSVLTKKKIGAKILYMAMKEGFGDIKKMNLPVLYAIKEEGLESADRLLKKFGFVYTGRSQVGEVYQWQK